MKFVSIQVSAVGAAGSHWELIAGFFIIEKSALVEMWLWLKELFEMVFFFST